MARVLTPARLAAWRQAMAEAPLRAVDRFVQSPAWRRSSKGNRTRWWDGQRVTVYRTEHDTFGWCIAAGDGDRRFSEGDYDTEEEAMESAGMALIL